MPIDNWERLVQETSSRYESCTEPRGISERRLRERRILDADAPFESISAYAD